MQLYKLQANHSTTAEVASGNAGANSGLLTEAGVGYRTQRANTEVARLQMFNGSSGKVLGFVKACKLYIRMKIRE